MRGDGGDLHQHLAEVAAAQHLAEACRDVLKSPADVFAVLDLPHRYRRRHFGEEVDVVREGERAIPCGLFGPMFANLAATMARWPFSRRRTP
jgi:hypothetical protein